MAVLSLAIAGIFALLLATSRVPGIEDVLPWPLDFFNKGLVIHVVFSFIVWFLAVFGAILSIVAARLTNHRSSASSIRFEKGLLTIAYASTVMLFAPSFMDDGEATLNNYIPAITDPLYYAGLMALAGTIGVMALRVIAAVPGSQGRWKEPVSFGALIVALIYLLALIEFTITASRLGAEEFSYEYNEALFWGGGHTLQFINLGLLFIALGALMALSFRTRYADPKKLPVAAYMVLVMTAFAGLYITLVSAPEGDDYWTMFTTLQYGMALPSLLFGLPLLLAVMETRASGTPLPWREPVFLCLALSPLVFAVGGFLGLFVDGEDTRTPAHYHGVIAGINLSLMGLFYGLFLPLLGRGLKRSKALTAQIWMFGGGQLLASIGLFLAGGYGTPRKTAGGAQNLSDIGAIIGMYLNGIGALIAITGGVMFIWMTARALLAKKA